MAVKDATRRALMAALRERGIDAVALAGGTAAWRDAGFPIEKSGEKLAYIASGIKKHGKHEALADIYESIEEMKYYREHFIRLEE